MDTKKFIEIKNNGEYYNTRFAIVKAKSALTALAKVNKDLYDAVACEEDLISELTDVLNQLDNGHCFTFDNPQLYYYNHS